MTNLIINSFVESERNKFEIVHNNMFAFSFSQVTRYYDFLLIVRKRYEESSKLFIANFKEFQDRINKIPGSHPMTPKQIRIQSAESLITTKLHLEIESFYIFAKIMLDQLSRAIELYFGQARNLTLDSHDDFCKNISRYTLKKGIIIRKKLIDSAEKLKSDISDFRDKEIAHNKKPRTVRGTMFSATGETSMMLSNIYPKLSDKQVESKHINELLSSIDNYIDEIIVFLQTNNSKTNLLLVNKQLGTILVTDVQNFQTRKNKLSDKLMFGKNIL